jgi:hypothetical protein
LPSSSNWRDRDRRRVEGRLDPPRGHLPMVAEGRGLAPSPRAGGVEGGAGEGRGEGSWAGIGLRTLVSHPRRDGSGRTSPWRRAGALARWAWLDADANEA